MRKSVQFSCFVMFAMLLLPLSIWSQSFSAIYNFANVTATTGTTDPTPVPSAAGVIFSSFTAVGQTTLNPNASARFSFTGQPLGAVTASDVFTGSINTNQYYEVTVTPTPGTTLDLNSIKFTLQRSGTGIRQYAVRSSFDYTTNLPASIFPANSDLSVVATNVFQVVDPTTAAEEGSTITLGSSFDAITSAVTFRFYGWNAEASGGTFSIDNVTINGTAIQVTGLPSVNLSVSSNTGTEAGTTAITVTATASEAVTINQTVDLTVTGTNINTGDYSLSSNIVTIPAGQTSGSVTFTVIDDLLFEGEETAILSISNPSEGISLGNTTTQNIVVTDNEAAPPVEIVINEVYGGGGNGGSNFRNDFIELYNNSNSPFNLSGWSVQYNSAAGIAAWQVTNLSGIIPAHGYYLIQQAAGAGGIANLPTPDATGAIAMAAGAGKVALVNNTVALVGQNPTSVSIIDKVAYGSVTGGGFEGTASAPAPSAVNSIQRTPIGFDSDNNNTDFTSGLPTPKNSVTDVTAPVVTAFTPSNSSANVSTSFIAVIAFNENVEKGTGTITFKKTSDGSIVKTFDVSSADVTVAGNTASFLIQGLAFSTSYYFEVSNAAIKDPSGNNFAGFSSNSTWSFTTRSQPLGIVGNLYNFNTCTTGLTDGFSFFSSVGAQVWACTEFGRNAADLPLGSAPNGVQINGFAGGTNVPNVDWLISPSFDLTTTTYPLLSFWSRVRFNGQPLKLKVSTDYVSGDPSSATWIDLNGKFPGATSDTWTLSENINLTAYKQSNVHFAFVYYSDEDEGARWTVDDISLGNSPVPPPPSLTVSTTDVQFAFAASGTTATKTFNFIGNDLTNDLTLTSTGAFSLSKDGISFSSSINYTIAEANNVSKTVHVRFSPTQNNRDFTGNITITTGAISEIVSLGGTSIDPVTTLEVVNWNIEWFGSTGNGPTNDPQQEQNVKTIFENLNADVYALTEIVSEERLAAVVAQMPGYAYTISNYGSHSNTSVNPASALATAQKMAFIYKTDVLSNVSTTALLSQGINSAADLSNPAYNYWASGRFPYMLTADVTLNCVTKQVRFVLVHGKANTSPTLESYNRRKRGADTLHYTLQQNYANDNIIILGDYNDDLDVTITAGINPPVTSYSIFTNDAANFTPVTLALSLAGKKSTVSYNDVIDHVTVSNELNGDYLPGSANILTDVTSLVSNYGSTTSDHYPVFSRFRFNNTTAPVVTTCTATVSFCAVTSNSYTIPVFAATDDCGDAIAYAYSIKGATERSGSSNDASGTFNIGTSLIVWTATDSWGNAATCSTTVVINANPTVTIADAYALPTGTLANTVYIGYAPASSITLTAAAGGGTPAYTYSWTSGSLAATTTVSPVTATNYSVTVTDANGCKATADKTVDVLDIRSGKKLDKVTICHKGNGISISQTDVPDHMAHGDMLGGCSITSPAANARAGEAAISKFSVQVLPNPSPVEFTLLISGLNPTEKANLRIMDIQGRILEQRTNINPSQKLIVGEGFRAGVYFAEITQGSERKVIKLLKL
ncbi:T9SS-dependent choice-of-anchor J family protein [Lacibacter sp. H407]|uniref:T9SS-dependent choice-of-anchor J family protein n=1 Tax=Lacibacter sp. H407 TaxID=3133423 RepID=UPI0030C4CD9A